MKENDDPNLTISKSPDESKIIFRALRDVSTGEQLTISYNTPGQLPDSEIGD